VDGGAIRLRIAHCWTALRSRKYSSGKSTRSRTPEGSLCVSMAHPPLWTSVCSGAAVSVPAGMALSDGVGVGVLLAVGMGVLMLTGVGVTVGANVAEGVALVEGVAVVVLVPVPVGVAVLTKVLVLVGAGLEGVGVARGSTHGATSNPANTPSTPGRRRAR